MKWSELSFKEKKQIYDNIRADNPNATYLDIKNQFDSIPAYEDGKKPEWMKPVKSNVSHWEQFTTDAGKVLSGLNNTIGTALTGASLGTTGLWNAARILNVGKGTAWRLGAAKNALTGAKAGLAADIGSFVEDPSLTNAAQVGLSKVGSKDLTTTSNKLVNLISNGFDFDDITKVPAYEDGVKKKTSNMVLPPEYTAGTPEYFERQRKISGRADMVQPEAYVTPAGYIKDVINFVEDLGKGDYTGAALDAALNLIPWGVGKTVKNIKSKVGRVAEATDSYTSQSYAEPFAPTRTRKLTKKQLKEQQYDAEFNEYLPRQINASKYDSEISRSIDDAIFSDKDTKKLIEEVDNTYGTNYKNAYNRIAYQDMTNRGKYVKWAPLQNKYGTVYTDKVMDNVMPTSVEDYMMSLDLDRYIPGTANHELGHIADGIAGATKYYDIDSGKDYITNGYLRYLTDPANAMSEGKLKKLGLNEAAKNRGYLLNPTEAKSHMLTLKRALKDSGEIYNWSSPINEEMILRYFQKSDKNSMIKNQYDLYNNKQNYIDRLNKLVPMEIITPIGGAGLIINESNKE